MVANSVGAPPFRLEPVPYLWARDLAGVLVTPEHCIAAADNTGVNSP